MSRRETRSSIGNALKMMKLFTEEEPELSVSQLANRLGVSVSTAHRLASTLLQGGFLRRDPATKMYDLGVSVLYLGNIVSRQLDVFSDCTPVLEALMERSGETAHVAVLRGTSVLYLHKVESRYPVRLLSHQGKLNPVHCTSSGLAILAYQSETEIQRVLDSELKRYTERTITSAGALSSALHQVRRQGYAVNTEEFIEGVTAVAAPVQRKTGQVIAAVSIAGPTERVNSDTVPRMVKFVVQAARALTDML